MNISEIKVAIAKGLTVACGDSRHVVVLDSLELWGLAVLDIVGRKSVELTLCQLDDCFIVEGE